MPRISKIIPALQLLALTRWPEDIAELADHWQFYPPAGGMTFASGFVENPHSQELVTPIGEGWLAMRLEVCKKIIPSSAVKAELDRQIAGMPHKPCKEECDMLREGIIADLARHAVGAHKRIQLFLNGAAGMVLVASASPADRKAVEMIFNNMLRQPDDALVGARFTQQVGIHDLCPALTQRVQLWLDNARLPLSEQREIMSELELHAPVSMSNLMGQSIRLAVDQLDSGVDGIGEALHLKMRVKQIALYSKANKASFKISHPLILSGIYHEVGLPPQSGEKEQQAWINQAMTELLIINGILRELAHEFGEFKHFGRPVQHEDGGENAEE